MRKPGRCDERSSAGSYAVFLLILSYSPSWVLPARWVTVTATAVLAIGIVALALTEVLVKAHSTVGEPQQHQGQARASELATAHRLASERGRGSDEEAAKQAWRRGAEPEDEHGEEREYGGGGAESEGPGRKKEQAAEAEGVQPASDKVGVKLPAGSRTDGEQYGQKMGLNVQQQQQRQQLAESMRGGELAEGGGFASPFRTTTHALEPLPESPSFAPVCPPTEAASAPLWVPEADANDDWEVVVLAQRRACSYGCEPQRLRRPNVYQLPMPPLNHWRRRTEPEPPPPAVASGAAAVLESCRLQEMDVRRHRLLTM